MRSFLIIFPALWLVSCASSSKSYYLLTPQSAVSAANPDGPGIGVGPVTVAGYLQRDNLVLQEAGNRLAISESHRWAGDLAGNIASVTATNLSGEKQTANVRVYPWESDTGLKWQVSLDITHMHGDHDGNAILDASWRVYALPARSITASRSWSGTEPLLKDGYDELAAAESRLLARLSREIASSLK